MEKVTIEVVASAIVGIILVFGLVKRIWEGVSEARAALRAQNSNPLITAAGAVWDSKERDRFMGLMERLVAAQENQAKSLGDITNQQDQDMRDKIDQLVERLEIAERRKPPARRRTKSTG